MAADESEQLEIHWLQRAASVSDFALLNEICSSPEGSTFVASCTMDRFPWPERRYLLKLEAAPSSEHHAQILTRFQRETRLFTDLASCPRTAKLLAQFEDTIEHFLLPHNECSGCIDAVCYVWQHYPSVKSIRPRLPSPLPCRLALHWTTDILEAFGALTARSVTPVTLKREFLGVDRQYRLVICPAAVGEHLTFQDCGNSKEDCDLSDDEGAVGQARKINQTLAIFCSQLIWGHCSARKGQETIADWKPNDLDMESLSLLPREYPTGFSEVLHSLMSRTSEKGVTLEEALLKLRSLEDTLEKNGGVDTVRGADLGKLTAMLTMAMKNQIGALRRRERQLMEERDTAIKSLEDETSKQEGLVEEIELLAKEKHALAREQETMTKKLKKLTHRRNVYAKKYRLAAAGKLVDGNNFSTEERCWRHSRNLEKCEALLKRHELALQELQRLADEDEDYECADRSGVDSEGSGDSALPASDEADFPDQTDSDHDPRTLTSFCDDGNDNTVFEQKLKSLGVTDSGGLQGLQSYRPFRKKGQGSEWLPAGAHLLQDTGGGSSITLDQTKTTRNSKPVERLSKTKEMEGVIPLEFPCGWWKKEVAGKTAVTAHELDSQKLVELCAELSSASCAIQLLEVGWTDLAEDGCVYLAEALKKNATVQDLSLHHCEINAEGAAVLAAALDCCQSVKTVRLNWNNVGNMGVAHFIPLLKRNSNVTSFELCWNDIDYQGAESLAVALAGNCSLTSLNLSNNHIGPQGACRLAEALIQNNILTKLGLKGNGIGGKGARAIFRAVKEKTNLKHLDLSYNDFGDETVSVFANVLLEDKSGLTVIDLSGNDIKSPGACQIALGLKNNKTLSHLNLAENGIDDSGGIELASVLMGGCHLCCIGISGNQLSREIVGFVKDTEKQQTMNQPMDDDWDGEEWTV